MTEEAARTSEDAAARLVNEGDVAWLYLDDPDKKVNTLSTRMIDRFEELIEQVEQQRPQGLVVISGKPEGFVAGADIEELQTLADPADVRAMLTRGHALCERIRRMPFPVVAAIHGACLGGGLELALACHRRVATEHRKTKLGLPEVQLGLFPGLGGTQRLPRLIGVADALPMVLTGKQLDARRARRLGLVDATCQPADLRKAALALVTGPSPRRPKRPLATRVANFLARVPGLKGIVYGKARKGVLKATAGHYPAPLKALEVVRKGMSLALPKALELEARGFAELVVSEEAKRLISIFFMKNDVDGRAAALAASTERDPQRLGVLGAGFMGSGIAQVLAYKDRHVVLKDRDLDAVGRGLAHCRGLFDKLVKRRRMKPMERDLAMARILGTDRYEAFKPVDFVIEAVFEDLDVKHQVIREVEAAGSDDLIFASNTSTIPISDLAKGSQRPENVVGMHFFSPVHKMPLLEIIRHPETSDETVATTVKVGLTMGKTVIVVNDGPGFFTSRVLGPFLNEAAWILAKGARIEQIDRALTRWGWPVGPITLLDEVGIDIAAHAGGVMIEHFGDRLAPPAIFQRLIDDGRTGRKGKRGFYTYGDGPKKVDPAVYPLIDWQEKAISDEEIVERCWMQMLNEVAYCIQDGIVDNPADIDLGVIFGFGFPPFRGGILQEADRLGLQHVVDRLQHYAETQGPRLTPAPLLVEMAAEGKTFHPR